MDITFQEIMNTEKSNYSTFMEMITQGKNGLIPVLGAGCSCSVGLPDWTNLLRKVASIDDDCNEEIERLISKRQFEEAAEYLVSYLGIVVFNRQLRKHLNSECYINSFPYYMKLLPQTFSGPIITLNFDHVIEDCFAKHTDISLQTFIPSNTFQDNAISEAIRHNKRILIKMHGSLEIPESLVFTKTDYDKVYGCTSVDRTLPMPHIFEQAISKNPVLFLGCSLNHDRFIDIMNEITFGENYALLEMPETKEELAQKRKELGDLRIFPIWYPRNTDKTQVVNVFVSYLNEAIHKNYNEITKGSIYCLEEYSLLNAFSSFNKTLSSSEVKDVTDQIVNYNKKIKKLNVFDSLRFGSYYLSRTSYPSEDRVKMGIEWIVLKKETNRILVVSKDCLFWEFFDGSHSYMFSGTFYSEPWKSSSIRNELQKRFSVYFNEQEQKMIETTHNISYDYLGNKSESDDRLFLLSPCEIPQKLDKKAKIYFADWDSESEKIELSYEPNSWWLRDFGEKGNYFSLNIEDFKEDLDPVDDLCCLMPVYDDGGDIWFIDCGSDEIGIRPAMWLNTDVIGTYRNDLDKLTTRIDFFKEITVHPGPVSDLFKEESGHDDTSLPFEI